MTIANSIHGSLLVAGAVMVFVVGGSATALAQNSPSIVPVHGAMAYQADSSQHLQAENMRQQQWDAVREWVETNDADGDSSQPNSLEEYTERAMTRGVGY